jgi:hypothetical protein
MKKILFYLTVGTFLACTSNTKTQPADTSSAIEAKVNPIDTLKKFADIRMSLLDSRNEKAEILLGKPDIRGKIMMGNFYYMVYFNKVNDGGRKKHLVLFVDGKNGLNNTSPIYKIVASTDGETIQKAGNFSQWLRVTNNHVTSNSMDFTYGSGALSWSDIELGRGEIIKSRNNRHGIITSVDDLPIPSEAVDANAPKVYTVKGVTGRDVYLFYANNYKAELQSNEPSEHKYLYMPLTPNDRCILLIMTGSIDGSIKLEFSNQCGGL